MVILQENKRLKTNNSCMDYCSANEFCLLTPKGARCVCANGYVTGNNNVTCQPIIPPSPTCSLNCNLGECKVSSLATKCTIVILLKR